MCRLERLIGGGLLGLFVGSTSYSACILELHRDLVLCVGVEVGLVFGTCSCSRVDGGTVGTELTVAGLGGGVSDHYLTCWTYLNVLEQQAIRNRAHIYSRPMVVILFS